MTFAPVFLFLCLCFPPSALLTSFNKREVPDPFELCGQKLILCDNSLEGGLRVMMITVFLTDDASRCALYLPAFLKIKNKAQKFLITGWSVATVHLYGLQNKQSQCLLTF